MPRHFAHYYFSNLITKDTSYALAAIIRLYPDAYLLGCFGTERMMGSEHDERLRHADPLQIFGVTARHIFTNGSKCQLAYMLGYVSHYALDRVLSAYADHFAANGVAGYFGGELETQSVHDIEVGIDRHIVRDYLGLEKALELVDHLEIRKPVLEEICALYVDILNDLADVCLNYRKTYALLEGIKLDIPLSEGMGRLDYMNRENREWRTAKGETSTLSVDEVMKEEKEIAYDLLEEYMAMARSNKPIDEAKFY